jgi:MtN3 and saliva related transmembrane protein
MLVSEIIGYIGGALTTVCILPQLVTVYRSRSVENVSLEMYCVLLTGQCFWVVYGYMVTDMNVIVANVVAGTLTVCLLLLGVYYKMML